MIRRISIWSVAVALVLQLAGIARAAELVIPGSGDCEAALVELAKTYARLKPGASIAIPSSSGTAGAIRAVSDGSAVLGRVARVLRPEEVQAGLRQVLFGRDAVVFAVGEKVALKTLTEAQLDDILSGRVKNWRDVGAGNAPIRLLVREDTDSTWQAIRRGSPRLAAVRFDSGAKLVSRTAEMIELVGTYKTSLGWAAASALRGVPNVRAIAFGEAFPDERTIVSGGYPFYLDYGLIYREATLTPDARAFLEFTQSAAARMALKGTGVVPPTGK